jgi:hypothetical protein
MLSSETPNEVVFDPFYKERETIKLVTLFVLALFELVLP